MLKCVLAAQQNLQQPKTLNYPDIWTAYSHIEESFPILPTRWVLRMAVELISVEEILVRIQEPYGQYLVTCFQAQNLKFALKFLSELPTLNCLGRRMIMHILRTTHEQRVSTFHVVLTKIFV